MRYRVALQVPRCSYYSAVRRAQNNTCIRGYYDDKWDCPQRRNRWANSSVLVWLCHYYNVASWLTTVGGTSANIMDPSKPGGPETQLCGRPWPACAAGPAAPPRRRPMTRFSPLKAALKYCRRRIRKFVAINNGEEGRPTDRQSDEEAGPMRQHSHTHGRHGKHDEGDDVNNASGSLLINSWACAYRCMAATTTTS